jgi:hypothetical protein
LIPQFQEDVKSLRQFLEEHKINVHPLDIESVTRAALAWLKFLKRKKRVRCPQCGYELQGKEHLLSDFYIGGFAQVRCDAILTRDRGIYRKYFPELKGYKGCLNSEPIRLY